MQTTTLVYRNNYKPVFAWVLAHGGTEMDAEDVFQEAMTVLFQKAQKEDFRLTCKIGTYLVAVSKFIWYKKLERQNKKADFIPFDENDEERNERWVYEDDVKVQEERELHFEQLDTALAEIGEPCRGLLRAFYYQQKNMQEIAHEFGYTNPENAKTQKYKCLMRLKKIFYKQ